MFQACDPTLLLCGVDSRAHLYLPLPSPQCQVCNKLSDLEYINWDDITGPRGMGSQLEWMCVGGKGTLYRGKWQVRAREERARGE